MVDLLDYNYPVYKTRGEVLKAAHENKCFYAGYCDEPFKESLKNSWRFYQN